MEWSLNKSRPVVPQICETLCVLVANNELKPGMRLRSVRETAVELGVNPNTVQKAFEELERQGLLYSVSGSGWYVNDGTEAAREMVARLVREKTDAYIREMHSLGCGLEKIKQLIGGWKNE